MKNIKSYKDFLLERKLVNKIKISIDDLINIIDDNELNLMTTFNLDGESVTVKDNISKLYDDKQFNINLKKKKLKKGQLQDTKFNETLLDDNIVLRFFLIHNEDSIELEEPKFIIIQYFNKIKNLISDIRIFENKDSINNFYKALTDKTIELKKGEKEYIYKTSNSGNNWELKNPKQVKGKFKEELDIDDVNDILKNKDAELNI